MVTKEQRERNALIEANEVLKREIANKVARKNILLKSVKITPSISKELAEVNMILDKKNKQLQKNIKKIENFNRV